MAMVVYNYFALGRGAKYCEERICVWVCLSACTSQKQLSKLHDIDVQPVAMVPSALTTIQRFLWMTSRFHIMRQVQIQGWSRRRSELFTTTRQVAPLNCSAKGEVAIDDCLVCLLSLKLCAKRGR